MPYTNPRGLAGSEIGEIVRTLCAVTLVDYTAGGTTQPAVDDIVTFSTTGNWLVKRAADNQTNLLGRVVKVEKAPAGSEQGRVLVAWLDLIRFVELPTDDLATVTLGNSAIKDGDTTVAANFDAGATTGNLVVIARSGATGAGTFVAAVVARP
jgi:hypothetical protein